ncbi:MAG TPA: MtsA protein, partial [Myxococcota bacterium]
MPRRCCRHPLATAASLPLLACLAACPPSSRTTSSTDAGAPKLAHSDGKEHAPIALRGISPRSMSNETAQPLLLFGRGFSPTQKLHAGAPVDRDLALVIDDGTHAHALLPAGIALPPSATEVAVPITLVDGAGATIGDPLTLNLINDTGFVDVVGFAAAADLGYAFTLSTSTDEVIALDTANGSVSRVPVGDGPWSIASAIVDGVESVVVAHKYAPELRVIAMKPEADGSRKQRTVPGPAYARALVVDGGVAYVGEHVHDTLVAVDLKDGAVKWTAPVGPNPGSLAVLADRIAVGSFVDGEVVFVGKKDGAVSKAVMPKPDVKILGGHTEGYAKYVMGGKGVRALAYSSSTNSLFVGSAGPNTGPNPDHMGVQGTGGVGVIDAKALTYPRHLGFNYGVIQGFALDDKRGRLYGADIASGLVHVVDAKALASGDDKRARAAHIAATALAPPDKFPTFRPAGDFGPGGVVDAAVNVPPKVGQFPERRAGVEVHTGPEALALSKDGKSLLVLERFAGRIERLDVSADQPKLTSSWTLFDPLVQTERRLGEIVYYADLGRTGMSCDTCHLDGHNEGVFF